MRTVERIKLVEKKRDALPALSLLLLLCIINAVSRISLLPSAVATTPSFHYVLAPPCSLLSPPIRPSHRRFTFTFDQRRPSASKKQIQRFYY